MRVSIKFQLLSIVLSLFLYQTAFADNRKDNPSNCKCLPNQPCWPDQKTWDTLGKSLKGKLSKPRSVLDECREKVTSDACKEAMSQIHNPFYIQDKPAETQSTGWYKAWQAKTSEYAIEAKNTADIVAGINFAREHNLKVVIKGAGHDYLSRNTGANSLLIWTHHMRDMKMHDSFVPQGCPASHKAVTAFSAAAGTRWLDAYGKVVVKNKKFVQGGGCTSVGVAGGFTQGGGFGQVSRKYGLAAGNMLEVEVVTADGKVLIANECQNNDLFWALKGGGGGTFGIVTRMTLQTFDLPKYFGVYQAEVSVKSDEDYKKVIKQFLKHFKNNISNEHWGEQFSFNKNNSIKIFMFFQDLTKEEAIEAWAPLKEQLADNKLGVLKEQNVFTIPAEHMWDYEYFKKHHPDLVEIDQREGAPKGQFWWKTNQGEASKYWYTYQSRWIPSKLFTDEKIDTLVDALYQASRLAPVTFHANKGLAGAAEDAVKRSRNSAIHPIVFDSPALIIMATGSNQIFEGIKGKEPNEMEIEKIVKNYRKAFKFIKKITPESGSYSNEADYFEPNWQQSFWGPHYDKLLKIKLKYDPNGLFYCHQCVGSEQWDTKGICPK